MSDLRLKQLLLNAEIARKNRKIIIDKLEEYYSVVYRNKQISTRACAILAFWEAKKQGRLDNLNRIIKINQHYKV